MEISQFSTIILGLKISCFILIQPKLNVSLPTDKVKKKPVNLRNKSSGDSNIAALSERKRSLEPDITWINYVERCKQLLRENNEILSFAEGNCKKFTKLFFRFLLDN